MNKAFRIFTINSGSVCEGAEVGKLTLKGAGKDIPAIIIGEEGRGRQRGVLPVTLTNGQYKEWQEKGRVTVQFAEVGESRSGKPKLVARESGSDEQIIGVFRTKIGFRGGNSHTGDRDGTEEYNDKTRNKFAAFPGEVLIEGRIAQGAAGNMGSGQQLVAVMPKNVWFRTSYSGRLYGAPSAHYYRWDGSELVAMTWDEREALMAVDDSYAPVTSESETRDDATVTVENFSRHPLSSDQVAAVKQMFGDEVIIGEPQAPFFKDATDFAAQVSGKIAAVVAPSDFLLEAQADGLLAEGTVLLFWRADQEARTRGNHASRALLRFTLKDGWQKEVVEIEPTVEVSFKDGTTFKYGGDPIEEPAEAESNNS